MFLPFGTGTPVFGVPAGAGGLPAGADGLSAALADKVLSAALAYTVFTVDSVCVQVSDVCVCASFITLLDD